MDYGEGTNNLNQKKVVQLLIAQPFLKLRNTQYHFLTSKVTFMPQKGCFPTFKVQIAVYSPSAFGAVNETPTATCLPGATVEDRS